jgi:hypothetical protein
MSSEEREQRATDALTDSAAEIGEEALAVLTSMDVLEHIPIAKLGVAAMRAAQSIRDQLLLKKIRAFLYGMSGTTLEQRTDMIERLSEDTHYAESVGEHLIELLDRIDGRRKALMSAAVFAAFARCEIERPMLYRLTHAIVAISLLSLRDARNLVEEGPFLPGESVDAKMKAGNRSHKPEIASLLQLSAAGLVSGQSGWGGINYDLTDVGRIFIERLRLDLIPYKESDQGAARS